MKRYFYLASAAIVIISACSKEPEEPAVTGPAIEVKTGAATIDETEVKLEGTYTYDGDQETEPGFRYGATQTEMLAAEIIPAEKVSGNAFMSSFLAENGEYYYQAVLTVGNEIYTGKTGWFEVSFSSVPEITTETADILQDGVMLNGTYRFDSKKIPIQVGFFYADNPFFPYAMAILGAMIALTVLELGLLAQRKPTDPCTARCQKYLLVGFAVRMILASLSMIGMFQRFQMNFPFTGAAVLDLYILLRQKDPNKPTFASI